MTTGPSETPLQPTRVDSSPHREQNNWREFGPVVVGGVGGSGTRVVAEILIELGYHMGPHLNHAKDNLWFTLLFRRNRWCRSQATFNRGGDRSHIEAAMDTLAKAMRGQSFARADRGVVLSALVAQLISENLPPSFPPNIWPIKAAATLLKKQELHEDYVGWGWKEPNSHVFLGHLALRFPCVTYIHVVRNGLDMAFSRNQFQLFRWGSAFGVERPRSKRDIPTRSLEFWIRANERALEGMKAIGPARTYTLDFDHLCANPQEDVRGIVRLLGRNVTNSTIERLCTLPQTPRSTGRHKSQDLSVFNPDQVQRVRELCQHPF